MLGLLFAIGVWTQFLFAGEQLQIVHSNDVLGELEPCGCRSYPKGGMVRREKWLAANPHWSRVQIDLGNLLFSMTSIPDALKLEYEMKAKTLFRLMEKQGLRYFVPGPKDFALGVEFLNKLRKNSKVKFLAANLYRGRERLFIDEDNSVFFGNKVSFLGIVGKEHPWPRRLEIRDPIPIVKEWVQREKKKKTSLLVLLTHQGLEADKEIAAKIPGIDWIFGGGSESFLQQPEKVGNTRIFQVAYRNQYLGVVQWKPKTGDWGYETIPLDEVLDEDLRVTVSEKEISEMKVKLQEVWKKEEVRELKKNFSEDHKSYQTFPQCSECHLKQFNFWRSTPHARAFSSLFEKSNHTQRECLGCHSLGLGDVKGYKGLSDLAMVRDEPEKSLESKLLHEWMLQLTEAKSEEGIVSFPGESRTGQLFQSLNRFSKNFASVQCEHCHSVVSGHPMTGVLSKSSTKTVDLSKVCTACHTSDRAPDWYRVKTLKAGVLEEKRIKIACPRDEK